MATLTVTVSMNENKKVDARTRFEYLMFKTDRTVAKEAEMITLRAAYPVRQTKKDK